VNGPYYFQIKRVERPSVEEFRRHYEIPMKPVVITGALTGWKAMSLWTHGWFKQHYETKVVNLSVTPNYTVRPVQMKISDYMDSILSNTGALLYMDQCPVEEFPGLEDYFQTPEYCHPERHHLVNLWIGPAETVLGFHKDNHNSYDWINNIFVQICGRKHVVMVSGDQDMFMYKRAPEEEDAFHSHISDPRNVDFSKYPLFRKATLFEAIVYPGEIVFIPGNYWHYVHALDKSISMSFWWRHHRIADIINRYFGRPVSKRGDFLQSHKGTITMKDVEDFGGIERLIDGFNSLGEYRHSALDLLDISARATLEKRKLNKI
jgi:[protein]-arginine 3-hydroxylase / protease